MDKLNGLFGGMKNDIINEYLNSHKNKNDIMFNVLIKQISQLFLAMINKIDIIYDEIISKIIDFYQNISSKIFIELKSMNEITFIKEKADLFNMVQQNIISDLFIKLQPLIYAYLYKQKQNLKDIENKLIKIIYEGCYKINENAKDNIDEIINKSTNKVFIMNLFSICKIQTNQEILDIIKQSKLKNIQESEFINKYINFKKRCSSLLITKLNEILKEYKNEDKDKQEEIIFLLKEIKNLEVFPELINKDYLNDNDKKEKNKNKKIHIFYLYQNIIELLSIENKDIQILIKDIMLQAFDLIKNKIPELPPIFSDEK
jgi:hypothetical protein